MRFGQISLIFFSFLWKEKKKNEFCCWIRIVNLAISEVVRSQTKKWDLGRFLWFPFFFCKKQKSLPKFCCWVLIEILAISEVFRTRTKKKRFGQISLIFSSFFWKTLPPRILLLKYYCKSSNFGCVSVPNGRNELWADFLDFLCFSEKKNKKKNAFCCWFLIVNQAISEVFQFHTKEIRFGQISFSFLSFL